MALAQKLRRWAPYPFSTRSRRTGPLLFLARRGLCSEAAQQQLTLTSLGFTEDASDLLETSKVYFQEGSKRLPGRSPQKPQAISSALEAKPSREEMKQAALEASNILAGIAGMQLPRLKKLAGEPVAPKQATLLEEGEEQLAHKQPLPEQQQQQQQQVKEDDGSKQEVCSSEPMNMELGEQKKSLSHPWVEWLDFLEDIRIKGFFEGSEEGVEEGKHLLESYAAVRHAVCGFGRAHSDIFRSLSRKDLRVVALHGCPSLERKASNASKRLRAHFRIPEGEVCQQCSFKMTCPRAFLAPPTKLPMNTLDVVRIIADFAAHVRPDSDCLTSYPTELETSICNLLREILTHNVLPRNSDEGLPVERPLPPPVALQMKNIRRSHLVDQKPGDWSCPNCEFLNFNRNRRCRECRVFRPPQDERKMLPGDWECPKCRYLNFSKNMRCRECNADRIFDKKLKWAGGGRLPEDHESDRWQERRYEASEDEESFDMGSVKMGSMNPGEDSSDESDTGFTDEEEAILGHDNPSNDASRKVEKPMFRWNYEPKKTEEGISVVGKKHCDSPVATLKRTRKVKIL